MTKAKPKIETDSSQAGKGTGKTTKKIGASKIVGGGKRGKK